MFVVLECFRSDLFWKLKMLAWILVLGITTSVLWTLNILRNKFWSQTSDFDEFHLCFHRKRTYSEMSKCGSCQMWEFHSIFIEFRVEFTQIWQWLHLLISDSVCFVLIWFEMNKCQTARPEPVVFSQINASCTCHPRQIRSSSRKIAHRSDDTDARWRLQFPLKCLNFESGCVLGGNTNRSWCCWSEINRSKNNFLVEERGETLAG